MGWVRVPGGMMEPPPPGIIEACIEIANLALGIYHSINRRADLPDF
jgi:hypothetical protein